MISFNFPFGGYFWSLSRHPLKRTAFCSWHSRIYIKTILKESFLFTFYLLKSSNRCCHSSLFLSFFHKLFSLFFCPWSSISRLNIKMCSRMIVWRKWLIHLSTLTTERQDWPRRIRFFPPNRTTSHSGRCSAETPPRRIRIRTDL